MHLEHYLQDGADPQSRAVLMALQGLGHIESSWNNELSQYDAIITVGRWENCREQGYVVSLIKSGKEWKLNRQLNIAFFEHRNSDSIHAVMWEQFTMNTPTIDTAQFGDVYKDKYDTSFKVPYGEYQEMAEWIFAQFENLWKND